MGRLWLTKICGRVWLSSKMGYDLIKGTAILTFYEKPNHFYQKTP